MSVKIKIIANGSSLDYLKNHSLQAVELIL